MNFTNLIGQVVDGKYKIERQLGKGGMGTVYLATHVGTERPVAVKVIVQQFMQRAEFVERFRREARAAGRLRHPNVVDVTDFGIAEMIGGRTAYLVMEYLDGCTLGEILEEEKQLPLSWSLDILEQVCSAVHEAHEQGIIHRDLKPDNIWLEPNQRGGYTVKVLDFGIAKLEENQTDDDHEGEIRVSASSTQAVNFAATIADVSDAQTIADKRNSTIISDKGTLIVKPEAGTLVQKDESLFNEKGTAIMSSGKVDLEDGTAIFPDKKTQFVENEDGTKLIEKAPDTDENAKPNLATAELTKVGAVLGTPLYMSPEQCRGEKLSPRSDIYSLGVIAYQMLGGKTPFEGDFTDVMAAHKEIEPPKLEAKKVPKKVKKVVHLALAKNTDDRPQTAEAFASKLRSHSEGIGSLLTRAMTIYSERLPKFLLLTFLISFPALLLTLLRIVFNFLSVTGVITEDITTGIVGALLGISTFFIQIFTAALLVGVTTWVVAQILAVPLRPIQLRVAFAKVKERWKPLLKTVTLSTVLAVLSWGIGFFVGGLISAVIALPLYFYVSGTAAVAVGIIFGVLGAVVLGLHVSSLFMLIAPSVMMEGIRGKAAFRRSIELVKRSYRTVLAAALLNYFIPGILGFIIAFAVGGIVKSLDNDISNSKQPTTTETPSETPEKKETFFGINFGNSGVDVTTDNQSKEADKKMKSMRKTVSEGIFELLWSPITLFISSFTSVITALIYFKTRQSGGESMQDLLEQFEDSKRPKSKWQERVEQRLIQSGRITSKT